MAAPRITRIPSLKTAAEFRAHTEQLGIDLPCDDEIQTGSASPLAAPLTSVSINGKTIGNRLVVQPMEGWDGTTSGGTTEEIRRRWQRFGQSGAKLICGGEAMAVRPEGRANPHQLILIEQNRDDLRGLLELTRREHHERYGQSDDLAIGCQLTHSGRFCRPQDKSRLEPRVAYRHPILDRRFGVTNDAQVLSDDEVRGLINDYIKAARLAHEIGADFVDIKHCHGYLLHEFLGAHTRTGPYGGSFENRTRILREIVGGIRADQNPIDLAVRLSAFDFVPFRPDPALSSPGKPGPGIPEDYRHCLPYHYAFGVDSASPVEADLGETFRFMSLCEELGIKILNLSAGSPYYNPHIQRPAAYPPSDGYQPPEDPLIGVARQVDAVRALKRRAPQSMILVGSAYSYLQEYLPHVAQHLVRDGWVDAVGFGRLVLSYPEMLADAIAGRPLQTRMICRTLSDCTTAPRNGLISGCYPLDPYYADKAEAVQLKEMKRPQN